ncbi:MinD/ParA family protein [Arthrobacter sp. NPDC056691]|uniref:MinD/ParA family ATP-binding protein n=1 Tax=Arthrobacter sp. NPDC056691 TaxID=3345913 RepID=UPI0036724485
MTEVNFPGARRSGMYVETEERPKPAPAVSEAFEEPADPFVEPADAGDAQVVQEVRAGTALAAPAKAPDPVPAPESEADEEEPPVPAREGFRGFLNRVSGGLLKLGPSRAEADARLLNVDQGRFEALIRQSSWTRAVGLLVANKKGTAGKTPLSILLGGVLAAIRGGSVAILETSDDKGQLAYRAEGDPQLGMGELVANIAGVRTQSQLRGYTVTQTSFASVIGSTPEWRPPLTRQNVLDVASIVDEHFTIRVMDTGNQYSSGPFGAAVDVADVLVIPTMLAQDAVSEALELLEFLEHQGPDAARLARTAIVVMMSDGRPEFKPSKLKKQFTDKGIAEDHIYAVPYDAHVAERGALTLAKLAPETRQALTAIAAGVVAQTNQNVFAKDQNR